MVAYLTVDQIGQIYVVSKRTIYNLANLHRWGRYRHPDGGTRYRLDHVDQTLSPGGARRHARRSLTAGP